MSKEFSAKQFLKHAGLRTLAAIDAAPRQPLVTLRSFLLVQHESALGTAVHTTPLVSALREAVPEATIVVAASGLALDVFRGNPGVDAVFAMPNPLRAFGDAVRWLRTSLPFDANEPFATLTPLGNERTAIALALWRGRAANRVGFTLAPELYAKALVFDPHRSQIANNLEIVEALGHAPAVMHEPRMFFDASQLQDVAALMQGWRQPQRPLVVFITQTSPTQRKSWRAERFAAVARFATESCDAQVVFVGTAAERAAIDALRERVALPTRNLAGKTDLRQLAALLSLADVAVSLDTGTLHVARAVGLPAVVIAPAWSPTLEWLPQNDPRYIVLKNADMPAATEDYIIDEVSVEDVQRALAALLAQRMANSSR